jgi:hypothetical protein
MSKYKMDNKTSTKAAEMTRKTRKTKKKLNAWRGRETDEDIQVVSRASKEATRHRSSLISRPSNFTVIDFDDRSERERISDDNNFLRFYYKWQFIIALRYNTSPRRFHPRAISR